MDLSRVSVPPASSTHDRCCQRTPRHTTHHKDLPEHVTITRPQHPLEGKTLAVFGQRRYQDKLHLILTLPKGGRALIPKEWTDIEALSQDPSTQDKLHTHLGSIKDLFHARAVVDALLSRRSSQTGSRTNLWTRRTPILQRMLNFLDLPIAEAQVWETLEEQQRTLALEVLARLIAKATRITEADGHDR